MYRRRYDWVIFLQCDIPRVQEDEVTIFLANNLIEKTDKVARIQVLHPESGSQRDKLWDPDDSDCEE